jgi:hypothetical protein
MQMLGEGYVDEESQNNYGMTPPAETVPSLQTLFREPCKETRESNRDECQPGKVSICLPLGQKIFHCPRPKKQKDQHKNEANDNAGVLVGCLLILVSETFGFNHKASIERNAQGNDNGSAKQVLNQIE